MTEQPTLPVPGYCWRCGGTGRVCAGVLVARGRPGGREFECLDYAALPCPDCSVSSVRDRWMAAIALGKPDGRTG